MSNYIALFCMDVITLQTTGILNTGCQYMQILWYLFSVMTDTFDRTYIQKSWRPFQVTAMQHKQFTSIRFPIEWR